MAHVNPKFAKDTVKRLAYHIMMQRKLMMEFAQEFMMDFDRKTAAFWRQKTNEQMYEYLQQHYL